MVEHIAKIEEPLFSKILDDIDGSWKTGGLRDSLYEQYAREVLQRYLDEKMERLENEQYRDSLLTWIYNGKRQIGSTVNGK